DGDWRRAPWIDLGDLRSKGAVVVWTGSDPTVMPVGLRGVAGDAQIQPPFTLPFRRGDHVLTVGWAILRPQPAFARAKGRCRGEGGSRTASFATALITRAALVNISSISPSLTISGGVSTMVSPAARTTRFSWWNALSMAS